MDELRAKQKASERALLMVLQMGALKGHLKVQQKA